MYHLMICTYYLSDGVSMVTETSGTRTGTLDSEYKNIGIIPIYFVLHWLLGLGRAIIWNCIPSVRYTGAIFFHSIIIHRNNAISMYPLIVFDVKNTEIVLNGLIISHILIYITKNNNINM